MKGQYKSIFWFSLVEVMIASAILSLTVFWVYKLIGENSKLISNKDTYVQKNILLSNIKECIEDIGFTTFKSSTQTSYSFNFWPTGYNCISDTYSSTYSFTGIDLAGKTYYLFGTITNSGATFIDWDIGVFEESTGKVNKTYKQLQ